MKFHKQNISALKKVVRYEKGYKNKKMRKNVF
jgi:hypothetical protein